MVHRGGLALAAGEARGTRRELGHRLLTIAGALLVMARLQGGRWALRPWRAPLAVEWACVVVEVAGFAFAWWARIHLGRLWSGTITVKPEHRVVQSGPYRLVRHPIYTGILLAIAATVVAVGSLSGIAGALLMSGGFYWKARVEESMLREELGPAYDDYRRRVPMLVPFV